MNASAGTVRRGVAYLIDCGCAFLIFVITQYCLFLPLRLAIGITPEWFKSGMNTELYTLFTISIPVWLYFAISESSAWRASLGKKIVGLEIVDLSNSSRVSFLRCLIRIVIKLLPWELAHLGNNLPEPIWYVEDPGFRICFVISGVLFALYLIVPLLNTNRLGIHDMMVETRVVTQDV